MEGKGAAAGGTSWAAAEPTTAAAADTDTEAVPVRKSCKRNQTEPNAGHLKCHKPCVVTVRRAEDLQTVTRDHNSSLFFVLDQLVYSFFDYYYSFYYILSVKIKCFMIK